MSNHGGRQVDGGVSSLGVLPSIVDAVGDKLDIFLDSGIRAGADIAKAMASSPGYNPYLKHALSCLT